MATSARGSIAVSSFPSSSSSFNHKAKPPSRIPLVIKVITPQQRNLPCLAVQESSTSTVAAETKEKPAEEAILEKEKEKEKPKPKPKSATKAPTKDLPQLMEEDVIPSLKATLETQNDITELELSFRDNKLEGSFFKKGNPYSFWAFFVDGNLTGPKGFSLSSYGSEVSTLEPFLVDEKKPTAKHVVFWVEKRLAAQGIIPVWKD